MHRKIFPLLALSVAGLTLAACATDDSLPSRPRTANPFTADVSGEQNAEKRELEAASRPAPVGVREFPGRSSAAPVSGDPQVVTLQATGPAAQGTTPAPTQAVAAPDTPPVQQWFHGPSGWWHKWGNTFGPTTVYNREIYPGPLPLLPANPGSVPMVGSTPAPSGDWSIDHSWGQGLVLENYPHRAWPQTAVIYKGQAVSHNPTYFFDIEGHKRVPNTQGSWKGDWHSSIIEVPWFYLNTLMLPRFMLLEPPLILRVSDRSSYDPNFRGHVPSGPIVPSPYPGEMRWTYPFLNPDGTTTMPATQPATTPRIPGIGG